MLDNSAQEQVVGSEDALDLNELAFALSQAATLASTSKKQKGSVNSKTSRKGSMTKAREKDVTIPGLYFIFFTQLICFVLIKIGCICSILSLRWTCVLLVCLQLSRVFISILKRSVHQAKSVPSAHIMHHFLWKKTKMFLLNMKKKKNGKVKPMSMIELWVLTGYTSSSRNI